MTAPQLHKWARRDPGTPAPVGKAAIVAAFIRLFAVQGSWNYETMIGNGIAFSMKPLLEDLPEDRYHAAMARQARYFNAHPYLAGVAVGSLARAELDGENPARIERFRTALCGPLGSVGDQLVWAGWLPLCSLIALAAFALKAGPLAVVCIFLGVYNAGHVALRAWGLRVGLRSGMRVAPALANPVFREWPAALARISAVLAGLILPLALQRIIGPGRVLAGGVAVVAVIGAVILARFGARATGWRAALGVLAIFVLYSVAR
ncbi:MAG TPA: PTS system mannose/fructose/sorbose family transporter subunit IID [Gemmatimonadaceae bacterium]|nr:PTS system mannose/fructose/sorbose family transporter subunit IID [Gemmatimonadaceae bacterium]